MNDLTFRWVPITETPKVGGTYMAGKYVEDGVLPRRFQRFWTTLILTVDGPEWADPGVEYYYPLPPHPESETARAIQAGNGYVTDDLLKVAKDINRYGLDDATADRLEAALAGSQGEVVGSRSDG